MENCKYCGIGTGSHRANCPMNPVNIGPKVKDPKPESKCDACIECDCIDKDTGQMQNLPRKEAISIQRNKAMDTVNEAIVTAKEEYQEAVKKRNNVACNDIIRHIRELAGILKSLEVYRDQNPKKI